MPSKEAKMINEMFKSMPREPEGTKHDYVAEREQNAKRPMPELPEGITLEETEFDGISWGDFEAGASEGRGYLVSSRGRIYHGIGKRAPGYYPVSGKDL